MKFSFQLKYLIKVFSYKTPYEWSVALFIISDKLKGRTKSFFSKIEVSRIRNWNGSLPCNNSHWDFQLKNIAPVLSRNGFNYRIN
jgi:hypothetical protein